MDPIGIVIFIIFLLLMLAAIIMPRLQKNRDQRK